MTPKRRLLTLTFACLCFKKSLLIKFFIAVSMYLAHRANWGHLLMITILIEKEKKTDIAR